MLQYLSKQNLQRSNAVHSRCCRRLRVLCTLEYLYGYVGGIFIQYNSTYEILSSIKVVPVLRAVFRVFEMSL